MGWLVKPRLFFLARCTRNQLIRQIEVPKAENEMLRKRVPKKRIWLKPEEKERLVTLALPLGADIKHVLTNVSYDTIRKWRRQKFGFTPRGPRGRPKMPEESRAIGRW